MGLLRALIDRSTGVITRLKRGRRVRAVPDPRDGFVKVNLGCGLAVCEGWMNVDASLNAFFASWPRALHPHLYRLSGASQYYTGDEYCRLLGGNRFVHHDLAHSLPFDDSVVDFVYSSHFLEHLFRDEAHRVVAESFRILKPGGTVRVCVPDLAHAIARYQAGEKREMLEQYFFVEDRASELARHKYMYDFELLAALLADAGFAGITRCAYREGRTPDLDRLDNRPEETLYVEARRPGPAARGASPA